MFSWLKREGEKTESIDNVVEGLKRIYKTKLFPLEQHYQFHDFHSPQLEEPDFDAKPMILLVGQYSTGKTTFIKYLLERDFPGIRIGPEPTTDRFIAVMFDEKEGVVPGNALVVDPKKQFRPLSKFGNAFLNRFQCSTVSSPVLRGISIVDTPGILSGEKQRVDRGYDFTGVLEWFAERVDRIILLFDAHKLDISDEFRRSIEALRGHDDKIRIVLNKADMIDHQQLMRVYGALMWSLGKVLQTPEVARVYIGSFWDQPLRYDVNRRLFEDEEQDLFKDMQSLPRNAALRKLNDLIKRARLAKVHAYIVSELRKEMPSMFGKDGKKKELIKNLGLVYDRIQREQQISPGDFPDIKKMQETLANHDFTKFHPLKPKLLEVVDHMLATDIAKLMDMIPQEDINVVAEPLIKGGAFEGVEDQVSPFGYGRGEGVDAGHGDPEWICSKEKPSYDAMFKALNPIDGKVTGAGNIPTQFLLRLPPHLRDVVIFDKTLQALLSSAHNCSIMTELCISLQKHKAEDQPVTEEFQKMVNSLTISTQTCSMIAQFLVSERAHNVTVDNSSISSAMSIHSLHDSLSIDDHNGDDRADSGRSNASNTENRDQSDNNGDSNADNTNVMYSDEEVPPHNLDLNHNARTIFQTLLLLIQFVTLLLLTIVTTAVMAQLVFMSLAYIMTGEIFVEFTVYNKMSPQNWIDKAKLLMFYDDIEVVQIHNVFELFYLHNVISVSAKTEMMKSKLPNSVLGKIWKLSDIDKDGFLDEDEFALAMHLIRVKIDGHDLPSELPPHLVPPSKRN